MHRGSGSEASAGCLSPSLHTSTRRRPLRDGDLNLEVSFDPTQTQSTVTATGGGEEGEPVEQRWEGEGRVRQRQWRQESKRGGNHLQK
uniref:Uncharacterized protein n=1 Tax=Oryza glumipatula TaxID=40148 RepID=A0A0E0A8Y2_9ORYZ